MIQLRELQVRSVKCVHDALRHRNRVCMVAPTGFGKRVMACWWAIKIADKGRRLGVVTDRRLLVSQMAEECQRHGIDYGLFMGNEPRNDSAAVQICSIQTLKRRDWNDRPPADWWIIDEAHKESSAYQTLFNLYPKAKALGMTATPVGKQGRTLKGLYDQIVEPVKNAELINAGWLLKTTVLAPSEPDVKGVSISSSSGEYSQSQLGERVEQCTVFADVFEHWRPYNDMQTIVFAPRVKFARGLALQFSERGFPAEVIEAQTKRRDRKDIFESFASREVRVLVSVDVLREGFDAPIAQCGIDLQPNHQLRTYWQKVGRIRRLYEGQAHAMWLDFAGNFWRFPHPDENPQWPEGEQTTQDVIRKQRGESTKTWCCSHCSYTLSPWERLIDGKCPNCGKLTGKVVRRIRMEDGRIRQVSARERKKRKANTAQGQWDRCRYVAHYSGKTLDFARWLYHENTGQWPPIGLKSCPDPKSGDWKRRPADVYPWMKR